MPAAEIPARHARLFEYLRQEQAGASAARRLAVERLTSLDEQILSDHLAIALRSWRRPVDLASGPGQVSAAEPRSHDEFFRAVRA